MSQERHTASSITDDALDALYANASKGWRRSDIWKAKAVEIETDRDRAVAAIERARALHKPMGRGPFTVCTHCSGWDGNRCLGVVTPYPCDTITALDEPKENSTP
jgi:hypothetical protein